jgi:hypothetical protein
VVVQRLCTSLCGYHVLFDAGSGIGQGCHRRRRQNNVTDEAGLKPNNVGYVI